MLAFVPATVVAAWLHAGTWVFVLAALALVPLALEKQLNLGMPICFESSKQIALLVASVGPLGHPITLE